MTGFQEAGGEEPSTIDYGSEQEVGELNPDLLMY